MRQLEADHGRQGQQRRGDELGGVAAVVRVHEMDGREPEVQALLQRLHDLEEGRVVRVQLRLARAVKYEVVALQRAQAFLQPVQVGLQELEAVHETCRQGCSQPRTD